VSFPLIVNPRITHLDEDKVAFCGGRTLGPRETSEESVKRRLCFWTSVWIGRKWICVGQEQKRRL